ncbi:uncharacterized protein K452DRAFT_322661 [Aplosporella prunicola CBS 121167]|uniref:DUF7924 domain-containing protein n=1 Tax=Aplosporella prunicola CBS 121167 TaxID=1176127 RepID=A0A6A6AY38_9PEZI|nr:uncharacterized protein K452DRAFT_322661 [Aplosporella prunicola CBS 121167]KAF2136083.1 hypothetical protein K452DRAFT_322661 [Aplosporella prunicola CBS 121167]
MKRTLQQLETDGGKCELHAPTPAHTPAPASPPSKRPKTQHQPPSPFYYDSDNAIRLWQEEVASEGEGVPSMSNHDIESEGIATPTLRPSTQRSSTRRSRSSSPGKSVSDWIYRSQHLHKASIEVGTDWDAVPQHLQAIIDGAVGKAGREAEATANEQRIQAIAARYHRESRDLDHRPVRETEWSTLVHNLVRDIAQTFHPGELQLHQGTDWNEGLKPPTKIYKVPLLIPSKRQLPSPDGSAPKSTPQPPAPIRFDIKTPRPDTSVSLVCTPADLAISQTLEALQVGQQLISDPQGQGGVFPFFVIEAKTAATQGTLYQAQNQASVSGACAINILRKLQQLVDSNSDTPIGDAPNTKAAGSETRSNATTGADAATDPPCHETATSVPPSSETREPGVPEHGVAKCGVAGGNLDASEIHPASDQSTSNPSPFVTFSVATQCSIHELWAHFWTSIPGPCSVATPPDPVFPILSTSPAAVYGTYGMTKLATYDICSRHGAKITEDLVRVIVAVLAWGADGFKRSCWKRVEKIGLET